MNEPAAADRYLHATLILITFLGEFALPGTEYALLPSRKNL